MNLSQLSDEEKAFVSRLGDLFEWSRANCATKFTRFLNERQVLIAMEYVKQNKLNGYLFYGGHQNAARQMLGAFAPYGEPDADAFPIVHITARSPAKAVLNHRDFLGTLMSLQITRESIGDILIDPDRGRCDFFAAATVSDMILTELVKVGGYGVKTAIGAPGDFVVLERFEDIRVTVGSPRLDSLVARLANLSREKASELIRHGLVQQNFAEATNVSQAFAAGDTVSIRGYGKYIVDEIGTPTKKGRFPALCRKYI